MGFGSGVTRDPSHAGMLPGFRQQCIEFPAGQCFQQGHIKMIRLVEVMDHLHRNHRMGGVEAIGEAGGDFR